MKTIQISLSISALALLVLIGVSCSHDGNDDKKPIGMPPSNTVNVGNVPHKPVPEPFVGDFSYTIVSSGGYNDTYGGYYSDLTYGATFHLNADGTGIYVFRYDITYPSGQHKSVHVDSDVAYEITKTSEGLANFVVHFVRGKNYEDGVFLHDLDETKVYPNGDFTWNNTEYGTDEYGRIYFKPGPDLVFTKQ